MTEERKTRWDVLYPVLACPQKANSTFAGVFSDPISPELQHHVMMMISRRLLFSTAFLLLLSGRLSLVLSAKKGKHAKKENNNNTNCEDMMEIKI